MDLKMDNKFNFINGILNKKIFTIHSDNEVSKMYDEARFTCKIIGEKPLISVGEWTNHIFIDVVVIYLGSVEKDKVLGQFLNGVKYTDRQTVKNHAYVISVRAEDIVEKFLRHFNIKDYVVINSLKYDLESLK